MCALQEAQKSFFQNAARDARIFDQVRVSARPNKNEAAESAFTGKE